MSIIPPIFATRRNRFYDPYSAAVWDPFSDYDFESAFSTAPYDPYYNRFSTSFASTEVKWKDTPEAHIYKANLPGFKNEDVKVHVEDDRILKITAEKKMEREEKHDDGYHMQSSKSVYVNQFVLPENARADHMRSSMENGVLIVTVPKKDVNEHHFRSIEVK